MIESLSRKIREFLSKKIWELVFDIGEDFFSRKMSWCIWKFI